METALFTRSDIDDIADLVVIIDAVRDAFAAYDAGHARMPPKSYIDLPQYNGDFRSMPAYVDAAGWDASGVKWVNAHPDNPRQFGLPAVMGVMVYSDPETARPLAILDGTELTRQRTAAAAAVATDALAPEDASTLGIVGAGAQSYTQVEAIATVRPIDTIVAHDVDQEAVERFIDRFGDRFTVSAGSIREAGHCDILTTATPVTEPIVGRADVASGTHVNAMGADAAGKQELDEDILFDATLVIDDWEQCTHSGEINVPWKAGRLQEEDVHATMGAIVRGEALTRTTDDELTVFDSTGLAIQDVAAAHVIYEAGVDDVQTIDLLELD